MDDRPDQAPAPSDQAAMPSRAEEPGMPSAAPDQTLAPAAAPRAAAAGLPETTVDLPAGVTGAPIEMRTSADAAAIGRLVDEILPLVIARFRAGRMGELEVRRESWHVRVRRTADEMVPMAGGAAATRAGDSGRKSRSAGSSHGAGSVTSAGTATSLAAVGPGRPAEGHGAASAAGASLVAISPGVGYYATRDGIATGSQVRSGDVLGHVDVLGVRQEVVAPGDGIIARLLAEAGEAVEYGQDLIRLEPVSRADPAREA